MRVKPILLILAASLVLAACTRVARPQIVSVKATALQPSSEPSPSPVRLEFPAVGSRSYLVAPGDGPIIGSAGRLMHFHVAIERDIHGLDPEAFVAFVEQTYGDPHGWTAGGKWRF